MVRTVEALPFEPSNGDVEALARLLVDTVDSGAAISFLPPLSMAEAIDWWKQCVRTEGVTVLVARDDEGIVGTVQLHRAWAPNQPHRADVAKLMVDRRARRRGVARELMLELEHRARSSGFDLLVLDTRRGDGAETLYRNLGYTEAGVVPRYARNPDGTFHDTVIFYKDLASGSGPADPVVQP